MAALMDKSRGVVIFPGPEYKLHINLVMTNSPLHPGTTRGTEEEEEDS